jgi:hypothetical protein
VNRIAHSSYPTLGLDLTDTFFEQTLPFTGFDDGASLSHFSHGVRPSVRGYGRISREIRLCIQKEPHPIIPLRF